MKGEIKNLTYHQAVDFILPKHYSGRVPSITLAYGWYFGDDLKAVVTYGKPASNNLCVGVCGKKWSSRVYELNRLCRTDDLSEPLSQFVSATLRYLSNNMQWIVVSYADTAMSHHGYIYQACNFLYTGCTNKRTDKYTEGNRHSRHYEKDAIDTFRKVRSAKHRYIYLAMKGSLRKQVMDDLKYNILPYPKGDNQQYELGQYLEPEIIVL